MPQQWVPMPDPTKPEKKKSGYDWEPMPDPYANVPPPKQEQTLWDQTVTWPNAVRMAGSTAGDFLGGVAAAAFPPLAWASYPALSFIGGAGSELAGQLMEGKSPNWGVIGTEGVLNPLFPGPNVPGKGAALGEVLKYGGQAAAHGAGQGLFGSIPRHIAETGQWELPSAGEMFGQTAMGGALGFGTGTAMAGIHSMLPKPQIPQPIPSIRQGPQLPNEFQQMLPGMGSPDIPGNYRVPQSGEQSINLADYTAEPRQGNLWDPTTSPTPTGDPNQGELNFSHYTPIGGGRPVPIQSLQNSGRNDFGGNLGPPVGQMPSAPPPPSGGVPPSAPSVPPQTRVQSDDRVFLPYTDGLNLSLGDPLATGGNLGPTPTMADMAPRTPANNAPPSTQPTGTPPFASLLNIPPDVLAINPDTAEATILKPSKAVFAELVNANYRFGYQDGDGYPVWIPDADGQMKSAMRTSDPIQPQTQPLPNHPAIPANAQPKDIGTRVEVDTVDEAEVARALKPEGFVLVGRTKQGKSVFEIPKIAGGSGEPPPPDQGVVIRQMPGSTSWGIYLDDELLQGGFFSRGAANEGVDNLLKERDPNYRTGADKQWEESLKGMTDAELQQWRETFGNNKDYDNPEVGSSIRALDAEIAMRSGPRGVAPFVRPENIGKDHYRLPDGTVVPTDATATKGQPVIDFQLKNREMVKAVLVHKGQLDKWGDPLKGPIQPESPQPPPPPGTVSISGEQAGIPARSTGGDPIIQKMRELLLGKPLAITESRMSEVPPTGGPKGTTGTRWEKQMMELDRAGAPDQAYRAIIASPSTKALKPGETWRDRVLTGIAFFQSEARRLAKDTEGSTTIGKSPQNLLKILQGGPMSWMKANTQPSTNAVNPDLRTWKERLGWGMGNTEMPEKKSPLRTFIRELMALPSGLTTTLDFSAPLRQGIGLIHDREFWKAIPVGVKSVFSKEVADRVDMELRSKPMFVETRDARTKKLNPSYAKQIGFKLMEAGAPLSAREEALASDWVDKVPMFRGTNRGFRTFLNVTRTNVLEKLLNEAHAMSKVGMATGEIRPNIRKQIVTKVEAEALDPYKNLVIGKEFADFVNTATGRGPLRGFILPYQSTEINAEFMANALSKVLFSPRLMASRMRMLSPATYVMASPQVRKQYMLSMLATMGAWGSVAALGKMAGGDVETDLTSSDFGKIRIGNTRLDPGAGFQQYLVAGARALRGGYTSAATGQYHRYGSGFQATTQADAGERFFVNKLNPIAKFWYDIGNASQYQPFHTMDRTLQMFVPLAVQDSLELYRENPKLLALLAPIMAGMGTQTYDKGESVGKILPAVNDFFGTRIKEKYITGGGPLGPFFRR